MGTNIKNLYGEDALRKIKELADKADICMFASALDKKPISVRPMSTQEVGEDGVISFFSRKDSDKNVDIQMDNKVQLFYANKDSAEFLSIYGEAEIMEDPAEAKRLWTPLAKTWFNEGADDPQLTIIRVHPVDAYYWDTKSNKVVSFLKIVAGAVTGHEFDDSVKGKARI